LLYQIQIEGIIMSNIEMEGVVKKRDIRSITKPVPTGVEIKLSSQKMLVSKTNSRGIIIYGNENFVDISGYSESELIGSPHNILRHPDMPKAIFYLMWQRIRKGKNIMAVVKNLSKNGDHYWVTTDFDIRKDRDGKIQSYMAFRQSAPRNVIDTIEKLYEKMLEIEDEHSMDESLEYLDGYLEERGMDYDKFIEDLAAPKGIGATFFKKMKNLFS